MTQRVRTGYRKHRTTTWLAAFVALLVALVAVPFATGANSKFYTLTVSPTSACSVPTDQTFTLKLTNQTRNQNLGSANITAPSYIHLDDNQVPGVTGTTYTSATVNVADGFDSTGNTIRLRGLTLPTTGSTATITVTATVDTGTGGAWNSIVKQSNTFSDSGPGNLFTLSGSAPTTTISACHYAFVSGPVNASKNVAQTVKVQLQDSSNNPTNVSDSLTLTASQNGSATGNITGLGPTAPDTSGALAGKQWTFSGVTGTVSGSGYALTAGTTTSSTFTIADCVPVNGVCSVGFTDNGDGTGGGSFSGSGLTADSSIVMGFDDTLPAAAAAICNTGWGWSPLTFPPQPPDGRTNFDGITLGTFSMSPKGFVKATFYLRNDLFVLSSPSNTNDIQICAGAAHSVLPNDGSNGFMGRNGIPSVFDGGPGHTNMYWAVLARIPNCNKAPDLNGDNILDPALCAWGTQTINGVDYRTATVLIPYDWDWKGLT